MPGSKRKKGCWKRALLLSPLLALMDFRPSRLPKSNSAGETASPVSQTMGTPVFCSLVFKSGLRGFARICREERQSGERIRDAETYTEEKKAAQERAVVPRHSRDTFTSICAWVDTSDFHTMSYCPTISIALGRPHEITWATIQHSGLCVAFGQSADCFPSLQQLRDHFENRPRGNRVAAKLGAAESPIRKIRAASPALGTSRWSVAKTFLSMAFASARSTERIWMAFRTLRSTNTRRRFPPQRPLLPFVEKLNKSFRRRGMASWASSCPERRLALWDFHTAQNPLPTCAIS